jgi:hypothetical protein
MDGIVPVLVPIVGVTHLLEHLSPLLRSEEILDVRHMYPEDALQLVAIPLVDDFAGFGDIIGDRFNIYVFIGMQLLQYQIFTEAKHLIS